jgi:ABC-2 type transport system permease protein
MKLNFVNKQFSMEQAYSQRRALWAITRSSFKAILSNPSAIFFSFVMPIIFIFIFSAFGNEGPVRYKIALTANSDTSASNLFYQSLKNNPVIRIVRYPDSASLFTDMRKGDLTAVLTLKVSKDSLQVPRYDVSTQTTTASSNTFGAFRQVLDYMKLKMQAMMNPNQHEVVDLNVTPPTEVRKYRNIDFVLPGMLGFSILFSTLFGIAFTFYLLREQLVLKRFYASPVNRINILLGIGASRLSFQLLNIVVLILFGHFMLQFTLVNGAVTFFEMILMTIIMLFLLMGIGLIISSIAKTDANIPLLINIIGFPQMLLSGTFFSVDVFPKWMQSICQALPLTQFNDAIRKISFEGVHIWNCGKQLGILGAWIIVIYFIAKRVIKWE